jgi:hypothetical protein
MDDQMIMAMDDSLPSIFASWLRLLMYEAIASVNAPNPPTMISHAYVPHVWYLLWVTRNTRQDKAKIAAGVLEALLVKSVYPPNGVRLSCGGVLERLSCIRRDRDTG